MISWITFHLGQINVIDHYLSGGIADRGLKALLNKKKLELQLNHSKLEKLWEKEKISPYHWENVVSWQRMSTTSLSAVDIVEQDLSEEEDPDDIIDDFEFDIEEENL